MTTNALPGRPGARLAATWNALPEQHRTALRPHLLGTTSADYLADWLGRAGHPISASTLRTYRRSLTPAEQVTT